jgi:hypothetical protein
VGLVWGIGWVGVGLGGLILVGLGGGRSSLSLRVYVKGSNTPHHHQHRLLAYPPSPACRADRPGPCQHRQATTHPTPPSTNPRPNHTINRRRHDHQPPPFMVPVPTFTTTINRHRHSCMVLAYLHPRVERADQAHHDADEDVKGQVCGGGGVHVDAGDGVGGHACWMFVCVRVCVGGGGEWLVCVGDIHEERELLLSLGLGAVTGGGRRRRRSGAFIPHSHLERRR